MDAEVEEENQAENMEFELQEEDFVVEDKKPRKDYDEPQRSFTGSEDVTYNSFVKELEREKREVSSSKEKHAGKLSKDELEPFFERKKHEEEKII